MACEPLKPTLGTTPLKARILETVSKKHKEVETPYIEQQGTTSPTGRRGP